MMSNLFKNVCQEVKLRLFKSRGRIFIQLCISGLQTLISTYVGNMFAQSGEKGIKRPSLLYYGQYGYIGWFGSSNKPTPN